MIDPQITTMHAYYTSFCLENSIFDLPEVIEYTWLLNLNKVLKAKF